MITARVSTPRIESLVRRWWPGNVQISVTGGRAVVVLNGVHDMPAHAMLDLADHLRRAMKEIGVTDVSIEIQSEEHATLPAPFQHR